MPVMPGSPWHWLIQWGCTYTGPQHAWRGRRRANSSTRVPACTQSPKRMHTWCGHTNKRANITCTICSGTQTYADTCVHVMIEPCPCAKPASEGARTFGPSLQVRSETALRRPTALRDFSWKSHRGAAQTKPEAPLTPSLGNAMRHQADYGKCALHERGGGPETRQ